MGDKAVMLVPDIDLEAQTIRLYRFTALEAPKPFKAYQAGVAPPPMIAGLQPPQSQYQRGL